jgi:hypothetical protein
MIFSPENLSKEKRVDYLLLCLSCAPNPLEFFLSALQINHPSHDIECCCRGELL